MQNKFASKLTMEMLDVWKWVIPVVCVCVCENWKEYVVKHNYVN